MRPKVFVLLPFVALVWTAAVAVSAQGPAQSPQVTRVVATPEPTSTPEPTPEPTPVPTPVHVSPPAGAAAGLTPASCLVARGARHLDHNPDLPLVPASTQKLVVATAAMWELGGDYRFRTSVVSSSAPADGTVDRLWLVGGGDPLLSSPEYAAFLASGTRWRELPVTRLEQLADAVVATGVRSVPGGLTADGSRHDTMRYLPGWKQSYITDGDIGPLGALTVNGGMRTWAPRTMVADPAAYAVEELGRLLAARGVAVGTSVAAPAPARSHAVAAIDSAPLRDVVRGMLLTSHNLTAEQITRELGVRASGEGTSAAGLRAITESLARHGIDMRGMDMRDGSGLDPSNRTTCRMLVQVLEAGGLEGSLAVTGRSGTLLKVINFPGRLRAKTGWITGAIGMVGTLDGVRFAVLQNGVPAYRPGLRSELDALARLLG